MNMYTKFHKYLGFLFFVYLKVQNLSISAFGLSLSLYIQIAFAINYPEKVEVAEKLNRRISDDLLFTNEAGE